MVTQAAPVSWWLKSFTTSHDARMTMETCHVIALPVVCRDVTVITSPSAQVVQSSSGLALAMVHLAHTPHSGYSHVTWRLAIPATWPCAPNLSFSLSVWMMYSATITFRYVNKRGQVGDVADAVTHNVSRCECVRLLARVVEMMPGGSVPLR